MSFPTLNLIFYYVLTLLQQYWSLWFQSHGFKHFFLPVTPTFTFQSYLAFIFLQQYQYPQISNIRNRILVYCLSNSALLPGFSILENGTIFSQICHSITLGITLVTLYILFLLVQFSWCFCNRVPPSISTTGTLPGSTMPSHLGNCRSSFIGLCFYLYLTQPCDSVKI